MSIRYLHRREIDTHQWDACIRTAPHGMPYAFSWYLDIVAEGKWDALIEGDYERVFPLPWNRKYLFFKQIYQPFFAQQLGLISKDIPTREQVKTFVDDILPHFRIVRLQLNETNPMDEGTRFLLQKKINLVLPLDRSYEKIRAGYSGSLKRNLKIAGRQALSIGEQIGSQEFVQLFKIELQHKIPALRAAHFRMIPALISKAISMGVGKNYTVNNASGKLLAAVFVLQTEKRIINLFSVATAEGRRVDALSVLFDHIIRIFAGRQDMVFDFEGSSIPSIADFFRRFGTEERWFPVVGRDLRL